MKKIIIVIFILFIFVGNIYAKEFSIDKIYIAAEPEIAGSLRIKEFITVTDQKEDLTINLFYKDSTNVEFSGTDSDLNGRSSIYSADRIEMVGVGIVKDDADSTSYSEVDFYNKYVDGIEFSETDDGEYYNLILSNIKSGTQTYYLEYLVINLLVEHNDCAELYYKFFDKFNYDIDELSVVTTLPFHSKLFKVWAHGNNKIKVSIDGVSSMMVSKMSNYKKNTYLDNRILYDLDLFSININENKKSKMDAVDIIEKFENEKIDKVNNVNLFKKIFLYSICFLLVLIIIYFIYKLIIKFKKLHYGK